MDLWLLVALVGIPGLFYFRISARIFLASLVFWLASGYGLNLLDARISFHVLVAAGLATLMLIVKPIHKIVMQTLIFDAFKRDLLYLSPTNIQMLYAGLTCWDAEQFSVNPGCEKLLPPARPRIR